MRGGGERCACFPRTPRFSWWGGPLWRPSIGHMLNGEGRTGEVASSVPHLPRPRLTHMAMSLASPGDRASSGPTSFTAKKWSWSCGQESAMWGSWYTS